MIRRSGTLAPSAAKIDEKGPKTALIYKLFTLAAVGLWDRGRNSAFPGDFAGAAGRGRRRADAPKMALCAHVFRGGFGLVRRGPRAVLGH